MECSGCFWPFPCQEHKLKGSRPFISHKWILNSWCLWLFLYTGFTTYFMSTRFLGYMSPSSIFPFHSLRPNCIWYAAFDMLSFILQSSFDLCWGKAPYKCRNSLQSYRRVTLWVKSSLEILQIEERTSFRMPTSKYMFT